MQDKHLKNSQSKQQGSSKRQRLSFPSIKLTTNKIQQKSQNKLQKTARLSFVQSKNKQLLKLLNKKDDEKVDKVNYDLKLPSNQKSTKQASLLRKYISVQTIRQKPNQTKKLYKQQPSNQLSKQQKNQKTKIYKSPTKREKFSSLPAILSEGNFIKKSQNSINSSKDDDQKYKKQIFIQRRQIAQPQIWVLKKHKNQNQHFNSPMEDLLKKKLQVKSTNQVLKPKQLLQTMSSKNNHINNPSKHQTPQFYASNQSVKVIEQKHIKQKLVGPQAVSKFYSRYKRIDKIKQLQDMRNQVNPLTIILTILQNYNIPPKRMDIIKLKGEQAILDLNNIGLGYSISIKAIAQILSKVQYFESINLSYNSISFDRVDIIIPQLKNLKKIDLSHNRIGRQGLDMIARQILINHQNKKDASVSQSDQQDYLLEDLNLEQNYLSDLSLNTFLSQAKLFENLKILNLSRNYLGNHFAIRLKQFLIDENYLCQLYLHWNDITSKGVKAIFQGLSGNKNLKVLDLSWNQIGYQSISAIKLFLKKNNSLYHLDISNCNINRFDTKQISQSLKSNHSIFGFHYEGNQGYVDSLGFLYPKTQRQTKIKNSIRNQVLQRIHGLDRKIKIQSKFRAVQNKFDKKCWICDGWEEKTIYINKNQQDDQACFIHFDFDSYKGVQMNESQGKFFIRKMIPFQKVCFFITKVNKNKKFTQTIGTPSSFSDSYQKETLPAPLKLNRFFIQKKEFKDIQLHQINWIKSKWQYPQDLFDQNYCYQAKCLPRSNLEADESLFASNRKKRMVKKERNRDNDKKTRQLIPIQIYFKQRKSQDSGPKSFLRRCAQYDINNSKIRKLIPSQFVSQRIIKWLQQNYSVFKNVYYYLSNSAVNSHNNIFHISQSKFQQFLEHMKLQTKTLTKAKIQLKIISTLSVNDQFSKINNLNKDLQQRLFNRPQFFEFLFRIAVQKYNVDLFNNYQTYLYDNIEKALVNMFNQLQNYQKSIKSPQEWRQQHLKTYDISLVIKSYYHFLQNLYQRYAGLTQKNLNTKMQKKMLLNQFKQIFLDGNMRKTKESLKDADLAFIQSKQMEIQEGTKQYGLSFDEFLQALIRMAYANDIKPINAQHNKIWERIKQMQNHHEIKHNQQIDFEVPLFLKVQALLRNLYFENRMAYHNRRFDKIFERGIFSDQIQMLIQILKQRVQYYHEKYKPVVLKKKTKKKDKINTLNQLQQNQVQLDHKNQRLHRKLNLQYLLIQLKQKFRKIAEQLDKNYNQYEEVQDSDDDDKNNQKK